MINSKGQIFTGLFTTMHIPMGIQKYIYVDDSLKKALLINNKYFKNIRNTQLFLNFYKILYKIKIMKIIYKFLNRKLLFELCLNNG